MKCNRRSALRKISGTALGTMLLTTGSVSASEYRMIYISNPGNWGQSKEEGGVDYFIGIDSYDVNAVDTEQDDTVDNDRKHDSTSIWGTVYSDTDSYEIKRTAHVNYISTTAKRDVNCMPGDGCGPKMQYTCDEYDESTRWQVEMKDDNRGNAGKHYTFEPTGSVSEDGKLENNDDARYGRADGYVGGGDEDYYEMTGNLSTASMYPSGGNGNEKMIFERYKLS